MHCLLMQKNVTAYTFFKEYLVSISHKGILMTFLSSKFHFKHTSHIEVNTLS